MQPTDDSAAAAPAEQRAASTPDCAGVEQSVATVPPPAPVEIGGPKGPEPTRFGDWEKQGRCIDF